MTGHPSERAWPGSGGRGCRELGLFWVAQMISASASLIGLQAADLWWNYGMESVSS